jgi:hypothetical protein
MSLLHVSQELPCWQVKYVDHNYITPWQSVFLEQLAVIHLIKKFCTTDPAGYYVPYLQKVSLKPEPFDYTPQFHILFF